MTRAGRIDAAGDMIGAWRRWAPVVARFSFRTCHLVPSYTTSDDGEAADR
ncbi:hypothetical protein SAMN05443287_101518 [Micromonospora phaseoli]|uniref:Uncharacterized protein n=1 Tax=Micromonospora phaseoli TaxID=1144548 RepID=A0A1H6S282_9ACTN|nr:hypothetical protein CLV64_101518 [Micromonospora phaseoli]GIJ79062.1 hypothetical protein Xph01_34940 [Micromonospora phaseoli]SEI61999.1 hypothetical protein SAMN05443287_101518 [Micromonospora phaseoli]